MKNKEKLAKLGNKQTRSQENYEEDNPTESDMILAKEYQKVKRNKQINY